MRMQQFFDYHLRGYPEPDWMIHGIPYRMKGRDQFQNNRKNPAPPPLSLDWIFAFDSTREPLDA